MKHRFGETMNKTERVVKDHGKRKSAGESQSCGVGNFYKGETCSDLCLLPSRRIDRLGPSRRAVQDQSPIYSQLFRPKRYDRAQPKRFQSESALKARGSSPQNVGGSKNHSYTPGSFSAVLTHIEARNSCAYYATYESRSGEQLRPELAAPEAIGEPPTEPALLRQSGQQACGPGLGGPLLL